jgi:hypothetical protein
MSDEEAATAPARLRVLDNLAAEVGATDLLVLHHTHGRSHLLLGGAGVGRQWAGTVAVEERDEPRLVAATEGQLVRVRQDTPTRVVGPYYALNAAMVDVHGSVVVLGGPDNWLEDVSEEVLVSVANRAAAALSGADPARDLVHELRTYQRIQSMLTPVGDRMDTAHHLAREAAEILAADFVMVLPEPGADLAIARPAWSPARHDGLVEAAALIVTALPEEVLVIQDASDAPLPPPLSPDDGLVAVMVVPLTSRGFLLAAHTSVRPQGFTSLDVDFGSLLAEAGSISLAAADTSTTLDRHIERVRWLLHRDPLTGLPDGRAFEEALAATAMGAVISIGLARDDAGGQLLRIVAAVLDRFATDTDLVAHTGHAEFGILLRNGSATDATDMIEVIRDRLGDLRRADGSPIRMAHAATPDVDDLLDAWRVAVGRMLGG